VPARSSREILDAGREMLSHPIEDLAACRARRSRSLPAHTARADHQGRPLRPGAQAGGSGLGDLFDAVEIVSDKNAATYSALRRHGDGPAKSMMVGNSLKSDVVPAIEAGGWGVHVPHELTWVLEHVEAPVALSQARRSRRVSRFAGRDRPLTKRRSISETALAVPSLDRLLGVASKLDRSRRCGSTQLALSRMWVSASGSLCWTALAWISSGQRGSNSPAPSRTVQKSAIYDENRT
jgi:hypothetical protein